MAVISIFRREEIKYLMDRNIYELLRSRLEPYMKADLYGLHTICSVYFDNDDDRIIRTSLAKPVYKEKLRLRSYGVPKDDDTTVFLELKKKYKGTVYKRRISLPLADAYSYIERSERPGELSSPQIFSEIDYYRNHFGVYPKIFVGYDRIALYCPEDSRVRVTFDFNIRCRRDDLRLTSGDSGIRLTDENTVLMEVKIEGAMPLWLSAILSELRIYPGSFSKYGTFYQMEQKGEFKCLQV